MPSNDTHLTLLVDLPYGCVPDPVRVSSRLSVLFLFPFLLLLVRLLLPLCLGPKRSVSQPGALFLFRRVKMITTQNIVSATPNKTSVTRKVRAQSYSMTRLAGQEGTSKASGYTSPRQNQRAQITSMSDYGDFIIQNDSLCPSHTR